MIGRNNLSVGPPFHQDGASRVQLTQINRTGCGHSRLPLVK